MSETRIDQICHNCNVIDKQPRHHSYDPSKGGLFTYCFACATTLGEHDYSDVIAGAEAAGLSILDFLNQE